MYNCASKKYSIYNVQIKLQDINYKNWLGAEQLTSHYLNQCWPRSLLSLFRAWLIDKFLLAWSFKFWIFQNRIYNKMKWNSACLTDCSMLLLCNSELIMNVNSSISHAVYECFSLVTPVLTILLHVYIGDGCTCAIFSMQRAGLVPCILIGQTMKRTMGDPNIQWLKVVRLLFVAVTWNMMISIYYFETYFTETEEVNHSFMIKKLVKLIKELTELAIYIKYFILETNISRLLIMQWCVLQDKGAQQKRCPIPSLIARFMGPTCGPSGAYRSQVGPMLAPWTLLSGLPCLYAMDNHLLLSF